MSTILEIKGLTVERDRRPVLQINALQVESGEILAIVGPNGTGKSSLLLTLARLLEPQKGEINWYGKPIKTQKPSSYRRKIAMVLQESLLLDMSVYDNVALGLRFRGVSSEKINQKVTNWLNRLGISGLRDRPGAKLSGGEAQRVSLARAFALEPELLLLDEPFSALDSPTRLRLLNDLKTILAEIKTTTIIITHDLNEASMLSNRVVVMLDGRIAQMGSSQEVFANPASPEVAAFLGI